MFTIKTTTTTNYIIQLYTVDENNNLDMQTIIYNNRYDFDLKVLELKKQNANFALYQKTTTENEQGHKKVESVLLGQN